MYASDWGAESVPADGQRCSRFATAQCERYTLAGSRPKKDRTVVTKKRAARKQGPQPSKSYVAELESLSLPKPRSTRRRDRGSPGFRLSAHARSRRGADLG